jgi:hypothetical protein
MRKGSAAANRDELRPEYDLSQLKGGVRGKYYQQATGGLPKPEFRLTLLRAPDDLPLTSREFQEELLDFARFLHARGARVSSRLFAFDAVHAGGGLSGEFILAVTAAGFLAKRLEAPLKAFLKRDRRARVEFREDGKLKTVEARGADEAERIIRAAAEYHKTISNE